MESWMISLGIAVAAIIGSASVADEIAMLKKDSTEAKREVYESYVSECISLGDELKSNVGY